MTILKTRAKQYMFHSHSCKYFNKSYLLPHSIISKYGAVKRWSLYAGTDLHTRQLQNIFAFSLFPNFFSEMFQAMFWNSKWTFCKKLCQKCMKSCWHNNVDLCLWITEQSNTTMLFYLLFVIYYINFAFVVLFRWTTFSDVFDFDTDIDVGLLTAACAREKWTKSFWDTLTE